MFDFYKEFFLELIGINPQKKLDKNKFNIEDSKDNTLLNFKIKLIIWIIGIMYFFVGFVGIYSSIYNGQYFKIIKYVVLLFLDIVSLILCLLKKRKIQKVAIVFIVLFIILNLGTIMII